MRSFYSPLLVGLVATGMVHATVVPTAPGPGESYDEGANCPIAFNLDTTGTWTNVTVSLMTGSNFDMIHLVDVVTGYDGTKGTGNIVWTCPAVKPNSAIYFYQFTNNGQDPTWTTRFTIASTTGASTKPLNHTDQGGTEIDFGYGQLVGAAQGLGSSTSSSSVSSVPVSTTTAAISTSSAVSSSSQSTSAAVSTAASTAGSSGSSASTGGTSSSTQLVAQCVGVVAVGLASALYVIL